MGPPSTPFVDLNTPYHLFQPPREWFVSAGKEGDKYETERATGLLAAPLKAPMASGLQANHYRAGSAHARGTAAN